MIARMWRGAARREDGDASYLPRPWGMAAEAAATYERSPPLDDDWLTPRRKCSFRALAQTVVLCVDPRGPRAPVRTLFLLSEELRAPMFDEAAVRETEHVQRLARDDAGLVDSIPTKTHGSPLLVGDEILDGHVYTLVPTHCLHDLSKAVGASNLLLAQALMIHVLRGDHRRDQIESTSVEDLDDLPGESFGLGHRAPLLTDGQIVIVSGRSRASWTPIAVR